MDSLTGLRDHVRSFAKERDWDQFHTPRNLCLALVGEIGELAECFQWKGEVKPGLPDWSDKDREHLGEELSDCLIYLVRLADKCGVELPTAAARKLALNAKKYPAELVRGSSKKYTEYKISHREAQSKLDEEGARNTAAAAATTDVDAATAQCIAAAVPESAPPASGEIGGKSEASEGDQENEGWTVLNRSKGKARRRAQSSSSNGSDNANAKDRGKDKAKDKGKAKESSTSPKPKPKPSSPAASGGGGGGGGKGKGAGGRVRVTSFQCHRCKQEGHAAKQCPAQVCFTMLEQGECCKDGCPHTHAPGRRLLNWLPRPQRSPDLCRNSLTARCTRGEACPLYHWSAEEALKCLVEGLLPHSPGPGAAPSGLKASTGGGSKTTSSSSSSSSSRSSSGGGSGSGRGSR